MTRSPKRILCAAVLAGVLLLAVAGPVPAAPAASSASPCWKLLLTDWYDGTIDKTYPIPCYQQAIDHLPTDAQLYSSAKDDIQRAMARAIAAQHEETTAAQTTTATTSVATDTTSATTTTAVVTPPDTTPTTTETTTTVSPGRTKPKGLAHALDKLNPGEADAFPLPLLILGGLAILLVAAGVIGMIWRRMDRDDMGTP